MTWRRGRGDGMWVGPMQRSMQEDSSSSIISDDSQSEHRQFKELKKGLVVVGGGGEQSYETWLRGTFKGVRCYFTLWSK